MCLTQLSGLIDTVVDRGTLPTVLAGKSGSFHSPSFLDQRRTRQAARLYTIFGKRMRGLLYLPRPIAESETRIAETGIYVAPCPAYANTKASRKTYPEANRRQQS